MTHSCQLYKGLKLCIIKGVVVWSKRSCWVSAAGVTQSLVATHTSEAQLFGTNMVKMVKAIMRNLKL